MDAFISAKNIEGCSEKLLKYYRTTIETTLATIGKGVLHIKTEDLRESMWARMKEELIYGRHDTERMTVEELKTLIWRYFISYWNNRRICSANDGLPPMVKRQRYYGSLDTAA